MLKQIKRTAVMLGIVGATLAAVPQTAYGSDVVETYSVVCEQKDSLPLAGISLSFVTIMNNVVTIQDNEDIVMVTSQPTVTMYSKTTVNIRVAPNTECDIVGKVTFGQRVDVIEYGNEWSKILYEGNIRYICSKYIVSAIPERKSCTLVESDLVDSTYIGEPVTLSASDRDLLERLVMGEAGGSDFTGQALVAQTVRDYIVYKDFDSVKDIIKKCRYRGRTDVKPTQSVMDAVAFIFDDGGVAVQHTIFYFYAPKLVKSRWHEKQKFITEYDGHRFFSDVD